jgi:hypothetical protein
VPWAAAGPGEEPPGVVLPGPGAVPTDPGAEPPAGVLPQAGPPDAAPPVRQTEQAKRRAGRPEPVEPEPTTDGSWRAGPTWVPRTGGCWLGLTPGGPPPVAGWPGG